jgi:uncharacterized protein
MTHYSLATLRAVALHTQRLDQTPETPPSREDILQTIQYLGCIQIDALQMVQRSQYVALWSRLGNYDTTLLDSLLSGEGDREARGVYEYWLHEASIIPLSDFRYSLPTKRFFKEGGSKWNGFWTEHPENAELLQAVLDRVQQEGALRTSDFEHPRPEKGGWWNWKPSKRALEHLYNRGDLMVAERRAFQRVYDLAERVLPTWADNSEPSEEEAYRYRLEIAAKVLGVCLPENVGDYFYFKRPAVRHLIKAMIEEGTLVPIQGTLIDEQEHTLVIHKDNVSLLERAADGMLTPQQTTFLTPFDNLFWAKKRDLLFWNFQQILEAYKPEPIRKWGYFCLPILHRDRLIGRFDPKLERANKRLRLKALHLEPGVEADEQLIAEVAGTMRRFMTFHGAETLDIERSAPAKFGKQLMKAL